MTHKQNNYTISFNEIDTKKAKKNKISTVKYKWYTFLPIFLYEQYKQVNNIYYLLNAIAGYIVVLITPITNVLPIIFVLIMSAFREIVEDIARLKADNHTNKQPYTVIRNKTKLVIASSKICQGDIILLSNKQEVPCDCVLLKSSNEHGIAYISTASLDGELTLKQREEVLPNLTYDHDIIKGVKGNIVTELPNSDFTKFSGKLVVNNKDIYYEVRNTMVRGSRLENTEGAALVVVYTGKETKMLKQSIKKNVKSSKLFDRISQILFYEVVLNIVIMIIMPLVSYFLNEDLHEIYFTYVLEEKTGSGIFVNRFITYFVMMAYLLPVSLFVTIELSRFFASMQVESDDKLKDQNVLQALKINRRIRDNDTIKNISPYRRAVQVKNYITVENLAEADILLSDKTGTLTKNKMTLVGIATVQQGDITTIADFKSENKYIKSMLLSAALCGEARPTDNNAQYQAESPDEAALAQGAALRGVKLLKRGAKHIIIEINGVTKHYRRVGILPFRSDNRLMAVVLKEDFAEQMFTPNIITENGKPFLLVKGAEDAILSRCCQSQHDIIESSLSYYKNKGLRTLVYACRQITEEEESNIIQSKTPSDYILSLLHNLNPLGVTAVEDELQNNLTTSLSALHMAGIRVWMLTGDCPETAVSVARAAGLCSLNTDVMEISSENTAIEQLESIIEAQQSYLNSDDRVSYDLQLLKCQGKEKATKNKCYKFSVAMRRLGDCKWSNVKRSSPPRTPITIVINSKVLRTLEESHSLLKLMHVALYADSVIFCRLLPRQKAQVCELIKALNPLITTVAIGDGANDVPMLREADVGIGVAGEEGTHACNNADITVPEFKFIQRLFFVHARRFHIRYAELFEYVIEKNSIIAFLHMVYAFRNLQSVQFLYDSLLLMLFNILITLLPVFFQAIVELDIASVDLTNYPELYFSFREKHRPSGFAMFLRQLRSIWYSIILLEGSAFLFQNGIALKGGKIWDINLESYHQFIMLLVVTSIEFFLHQNHYTYFMLGAFIFMVIVVAGSTWLGCFSDFFGVTLFSVPLQLTTEVGFYIKFGLLSLLTAMPSVFGECIKMLYFPSSVEILRYQKRSLRCIDPRKKKVEIQNLNYDQPNKWLQVATASKL